MPATAQLLTPRGPGAVAVIEVRCNSDEQLLQLLSAFSADPPRDLTAMSVGRIVYGQWRSEDVVVTRTDPQAWEIHCHGGRVAIERILSDLESAGAQPRNGDAPLFATSETDVSEYLESVLMQCRTKKTASIALAQTDGRLHRLWQDLHSPIASVRLAAGEQQKRWQHVAEHLVRPWTVALIGAPNAGKSSLINAIAGRQRSIVSETPGTTRDLLEAEVILDGWPFLFVDSAGIRQTAASPIEALGISRSRALAASADVVCLVVDRTQPLMDEVVSETTALRGCGCVLFNKSDLWPTTSTSHPSLSSQISSINRTFDVSAVTGDGLSNFLEWLVRAVIPVEPSAETCIPVLPPAFTAITK